MSREHFAEFIETGRMPATTETFTSPTRAFSEGYDGILVRFQLEPGTIARLRRIGVRSHGRRSAREMPDLPEVRRGWTRRHVLFKIEGSNVNIGLGRGPGLEMFNNGIAGFEVLGER